MSELRFLGRLDRVGRAFYVATVTGADDWPAWDDPIGRFVAFTALDARGISSTELRRLAAGLLDRGCVYSCSWGPEARYVEQAFDNEAIERGPQWDDVMTTGSETDSLDDALWYAVWSAWPMDDVAADAVVIVTGEEWAEEILARLSRLEAWSDEVVARDHDDSSARGRGARALERCLHAARGVPRLAGLVRRRFRP
jgi:hypothetical protein